MRQQITYREQNRYLSGLKYFVKTTAKAEAIYKYLISEKATTLVVLTLR